jgi:hypothetical protein
MRRLGKVEMYVKMLGFVHPPKTSREEMCRKLQILVKSSMHFTTSALLQWDICKRLVPLRQLLKTIQSIDLDNLIGHNFFFFFTPRHKPMGLLQHLSQT